MRSRPASNGPWTILLVALGVQVATSVVVCASAVLLPYLRSEYGLSFAEVGLMATLPFATSLLFSALAGWAADVVSDRLVLVSGAVIAGIGGAACAFAPTLVALLGGLLLVGVGNTIASPAGSLAVRKAFPAEHRGSVMSLRQTGYPVGGLLAGLVLPVIALSSGWRAGFLVAGGISLVVGVVGATLYRGSELYSGLGTARHSLLGVLNRRIIATAGFGTLLLAAQSCLVTWLVAYLVHDRDVVITVAGAYLALALLAGAVSRVFWGVVSDRLMEAGRLPGLLLAACTGAVGSLLLAVLPSDSPAAMIAVAIIACAAGAIGWNGIWTSMLSEQAPPGSEGTSVGLGLTLIQPGQLAGPYVFGLILDATGSFRLAWFMLTAILALAALAILFVSFKVGGFETSPVARVRRVD